MRIKKRKVKDRKSKLRIREKSKKSKKSKKNKKSKKRSRVEKGNRKMIEK